MSPAYPFDAVAAPTWQPHEWKPHSSGLGDRVHTVSPLARFHTWCRLGRTHVGVFGPEYATGYAAGWCLHGRRL